MYQNFRFISERVKMNNFLREETVCLNGFLYAPVKHINMKQIVVANRGKVRQSYSQARSNIQILNLDQENLAKCFQRKLASSEKIIQNNNQIKTKMIRRRRHEGGKTPNVLTTKLYAKHWMSKKDMQNKERKNTEIFRAAKKSMDKNKTNTEMQQQLKKDVKLAPNSKTEVEDQGKNWVKDWLNQSKITNTISIDRERKQAPMKIPENKPQAMKTELRQSKSRESIRSVIHDLDRQRKTVSASYKEIKDHWKRNSHEVLSQNYLRIMEKKMTEVQYLKNKSKSIDSI